MASKAKKNKPATKKKNKKAKPAKKKAAKKPAKKRAAKKPSAVKAVKKVAKKAVRAVQQVAKKIAAPKKTATPKPVLKKPNTPPQADTLWGNTNQQGPAFDTDSGENSGFQANEASDSGYDAEDSDDEELDENEEEAHPLVGKKIPALTLKNQRGEDVSLRDVSKSSKSVVLYFYPKDDTPGCTTEACGFRDNLNRVKALGTKVIGVSPDSPESHQKFVDKYNLNFDLLSDPNHELSNALKVWKEKNFMGKNYMGVERSTFIVKNGQIAKAWQPVKVEGHVDEVLETIERLGG